MKALITLEDPSDEDLLREEIQIIDRIKFPALTIIVVEGPRELVEELKDSPIVDNYEENIKYELA